MKNNILFLLVISLLYINFSCGDNSDEPVEFQEIEITNSVHKANIGKITFMKEYISFDEYSEKDFLQSFDLHDDSNLSTRVFLEKPLANYLRELAPELTANEIVKIGNYHFSFFVDEKLIYEEELNFGAGGAYAKTHNAAFWIPLASTNEEDMWGRFMWMRFMAKGGSDALTEGSHQLKIELRPYVKNPKTKIGKLIASGEIELNIIKTKVDASQIAIQPIAPNSDWEISNEKYNEEKIIALNKAVLQNSFKKITSVVVIKNEKLFLEEYFNEANRTTLHNTRSVGKTFASAIAGIAIDDQHLKSENQPLKEFYDLKKYKNYAPSKGNITLKDLLTMSSAFDGSDMNMESPGHEENMYPTDDWVKFALDLKMNESKTSGKQWDYFTAGVVVLGDVIHQSVPDGLEKYADKKLFQPLGILNYKWQHTPQQVANTAGGIQLTALDFAKFGQLYKNNGIWNGQQIISKDWVEKSLTQHLEIPDTEQEAYGYLFWNKKYTVDGKEHEVFYCSGNGGNKIFIFKDQPLVVVITAQAYNTAYAHPQVDKMMQEFILPAVL